MATYHIADNYLHIDGLNRDDANMLYNLFNHLSFVHNKFALISHFQENNVFRVSIGVIDMAGDLLDRFTENELKIIKVHSGVDLLATYR